MQESEFTHDEALAFIEAMRLAVDGKVGFKWLVGRLAYLTAYVDSVSAENEQLKGYLDAVGAMDDFATYAAAHPAGAQTDADPLLPK